LLEAVVDVEKEKRTKNSQQEGKRTQATATSILKTLEEPSRPTLASNSRGGC
jgi:hypothetical protein